MFFSPPRPPFIFRTSSGFALPLVKFMKFVTTVLARELHRWGIQIVADLGPGFAPANSQNLGKQITGALGKRHSHSCHAEVPQIQNRKCPSLRSAFRSLSLSVNSVASCEKFGGLSTLNRLRNLLYRPTKSLSR
jgi:hypothetical protein